MIVLLVWLLLIVVFAPLTAFKAKAMGQSFWAWLFVGACLPVISLAVVQYFEPTRAERRRAQYR